MEAISARSIGSALPAFGLNYKCNAIVMHCSALRIIFWFSAESNTHVAPSSMYPSVPPLKLIGSWTSALKSGPNFMLLSNLFGGGISCFRGLGYLVGSQWVQFIRPFARSKVMSEQLENSAGAGIDPNGSHPRATAISSSSGMWSSSWFCINHIAMHLAAIFPEVWRRRYAFLISTLLVRILSFGWKYSKWWIMCRNRNNV